MFDVGFWEICLVGLVALLVIGPERLPRVAREAGLWLGKARHLVGSVREEIKEELRAEELRQMLRDQSALEDVRRVMNDASKTADSIARAGEEVAAPSPAVDSSVLPRGSESGSDEKH
ncbi:MAG: Sec-independent protein translocase protein TatB [Pseudomonadota bacterium]